MKKIIELSENWRISIESHVIQSFWHEGKLELRIKATLEKSSKTDYSKSLVSWCSEGKVDEIIKSPNWYEKLMKISWSQKAQYYEDKIIKELKALHAKKIEIENLNKGLYLSLDSVKQ